MKVLTLLVTGVTNEKGKLVVQTSICGEGNTDMLLRMYVAVGTKLHEQIVEDKYGENPSEELNKKTSEEIGKDL